MRKIILLLCMVLMSLGIQAQSYDYLMKGREAKKAGGEQLENFKKEIAQLSVSKNESDMMNACYGYYGIGDEEKAEALTNTIKKKFPHGMVMRGSDFQKLSQVKGGAAIEKAYNEWIKKYPAKKLGKDGVYDEAAFSVASAYAGEGNAEKALAYVGKVSDPAMQGYAYYSVGTQLGQAGKTEAAGKMLKQGCDAADKVVPTLEGRQKAMASMVYGAYADWLSENGQADEAWQLFNSKVADKTNSLDYWKLALQHGQVMQTWTYLDGMLRKGYSDKESESLMKDVWQKANGNTDGFDDYVKGVKQERIDEKLAKIPEQMKDEPAPDFTLKDIDGNTVQLSKLKGKVVVLDFWATWCGPCKRSLPAMKMTLDKYKDDPDVVFLFIHTWERGTPEEANKEAKAYLHDNGFDEFHLVMDTRNPETKQNDAVTAFGVKGIPAKFVIDKQGKIRFQLTGFGGSNEDAVAELSKMIELARNAK